MLEKIWNKKNLDYWIGPQWPNLIPATPWPFTLKTFRENWASHARNSSGKFCEVTPCWIYYMVWCAYLLQTSWITKRLASASRSRVSILVIKNLGRSGECGCPCKSFPPILFDYHAKFGYCSSSVQACTGSQNSGTLGFPSLRTGDVANHTETRIYPNMCYLYLTKFDRSMSNITVVSMGSQILGTIRRDRPVVTMER